ncbi:MAG: rhodanese-like domain-containing protein [Pseudomonadota bacterium]|uniref:rhodanese-like domain-containing protein n=1 Tax=Thermithiobacillus tepidarius TaxID=929 RepID=UPI000426BB5E|nr:rhodanese-like domain-containing protein [Thermithiobacillus tepidarius]
MNTRAPTRAAFCAVTLLAASTALAADPSYGNRYGLERYYHSEISAAKAFLLTHYDRGNVSRDAFRNAVLIDVRTIPEYVAGHPDMALNIPYPHINTTNTKDPQYIAQNPKTFFDTVASRIPDRDTPILTLCRTGHRSVLAANILADPGRYIPEYQGKVPGYKKVRNIWEGFEGNYKVDTANHLLDVNHDGQLTDADKDGWKNYQELPYSTRLIPQLLYQPYIHLYYQR